MHRHPANPLITPADVPPSDPGFVVKGAFNPAACEYDGRILLLLRVAEGVVAAPGRVAVPTVKFTEAGGEPDVLDLALDDPDVLLRDTRGVAHRGVEYLSTLSHLRLARSDDGVRFTVDPHPFLFPADETERFGVEDARITKLGDTYWINYTAVSGDGWYTSLASTADFQTVTRHGIIFPPQNKDVSLFPRRIGGRYYALHRPNNAGFGRASIWIASSPDLVNWGEHRVLMRPRDTLCESQKIGGGPPCLETDAGWLQVYHGKGDPDVGYTLFAALLDRDDPTRVLSRGTVPLLRPEAEYERDGFFGNVVFANGLVRKPDGRVHLYYGVCDEAACLLETSLDELIAAASS